MNIIKSILLCGAFCACVGTAQADFLYWQVTLPEYGPGSKSNLESGAGAAKGELDLNTARLVATADGKQSYYQYVTLDTDTGNMEDAVAFDLSQLGSDASAYSFMIELGNATAGDASTFYTMGSGTTLAYGSADDYIGTGGIVPGSSASIYGGPGTTTYSIPEPSSGLMLLLGGSLLALRRRRK